MTGATENWSRLESIADLLATTPLHRLLGFSILHIDKGAGTLAIKCPTGAAAERSDGAGQAHGGAIATLVDTTATFVACVAASRPVPTMNLHVDYLRPAAGSEMIATATIRKQGRTAAIVDVEVVSAGKLVAIGRCTLAMTS